MQGVYFVLKFFLRTRLSHLTTVILNYKYCWDAYLFSQMSYLMGRLSYFVLQKVVLLYAYECFACMCVPGDTRVSEPLELELWIVISYNAGAGTKHRSYYRGAGASNY